MIIDTHCHLATKKYTDMDASIAESRALGVGHVVSQGTHRADWQMQLDLAAKYPDFISACLAVHPSDAAEVAEGDMELLGQLCREHPLAAIGETGLDYYWPAPEGWTEEAYRRRQHELLEEHFQLALDLGLNISLHARDRKGSACFDDTVAIARNFPQVRPVFHCFIGTHEQAVQVFDELDGLISITGIVTFKKTEDLQAVAAWCPCDRLMVETDAPFLAPEPHRGQLNIPGYTRYVVDKIAALRGQSWEEVAAFTTANAQRFFKLNLS